MTRFEENSGERVACKDAPPYLQNKLTMEKPPGSRVEGVNNTIFP